MKRRLIVISLCLILAIIASACSEDSDNAASGDDIATVRTVGGSVTLQPLFYFEGEDGPQGGTSDITLELRETKAQGVRVAIADDEVQGSGPQWEAAAWNAMSVSTLVTGASLDRRQLEVDATGFIDGPSAGALLTIGTISLIRGDRLDRDVTMTGTINPDGTVGPVGGISYKLEGAAKAGKEVVLIPAGQMIQRNEDGTTDDLQDIGDDLGIQVIEVDDIYDAYKQFTKKSLPRYSSNQQPELSDDQNDALIDVVNKYQQEFEGISNALPAIPADISWLSDWKADTETTYRESVSLLDDELPGAALARVREAYGGILTVKSIIEYAQASAAGTSTRYIKQLDNDFVSDFDDLSADLEDYRPSSLSGAATLIDSYGTLVVAEALVQSAVDDYNDSDTEIDPTTVISFIQQAKAGVEIQQDIFDDFSEQEGPKVSQRVNLEVVAKFFRQSADANIAAFNENIVSEIQKSANVTEDEAKSLLVTGDLNVALVYYSQQVEQAAESLFGKIDNLPYARLGAAVELYARSSELLAGYYSLGEPDVVDGQIVISKFRSEEAFDSAKSLAKRQLAGVGTVLAGRGVEPIFVASAFQLADEDDSSSNPSDAIRSLRTYWKGYVAGRVLTYLGGFPRAGLRN